MSTLVTRNIVVDGRRTSMRLEPEMWEALGDVCQREGMNLNELCTMIDRSRGDSGLTAATRVCLLLYFQMAALGDLANQRVSHQLLVPLTRRRARRMPPSAAKVLHEAAP